MIWTFMGVFNNIFLTFLPSFIIFGVLLALRKSLGSNSASFNFAPQTTPLCLCLKSGFCWYLLLMIFKWVETLREFLVIHSWSSYKVSWLLKFVWYFQWVKQCFFDLTLRIIPLWFMPYYKWHRFVIKLYGNLLWGVRTLVFEPPFLFKLELQITWKLCFIKLQMPPIHFKTSWVGFQRIGTNLFRSRKAFLDVLPKVLSDLSQMLTLAKDGLEIAFFFFLTVWNG